MVKRDLGRRVDEAYLAFKHIKDFASTADTVETIQSFLEYSIKVHQENMSVPGVYKECVTNEALDNITAAYNNIMSAYKKGK